MTNQELINQLTTEWLLSLTWTNYNSGVYGDWARLIKGCWNENSLAQPPWGVWNYADFGINEQMSKLEILKKIVSFGSEHPAYLDSRIQRQLTQVINNWEALEEEFAEKDKLKEELQTEREATQQALQTSQEWHERQKQEIIAEWKNKLQSYLNSRQAQIQQEITLLRQVLSHE